MTNLDIALIVLCIAGVALIGYLIYTLSKLTKTIDKINNLVDDNTKGITSIVNNVDSVTADAKTLTGKVTSTVEGVEKGIKKPLTTDNVESAVTSARNVLNLSKSAMFVVGLGTSLLGYLKESSENRELKKEAKEQKKRERELRKKLRKEQKAKRRNNKK